MDLSIYRKNKKYAEKRPAAANSSGRRYVSDLFFREGEIPLGVVVTDIGSDLLERIHIIGIETLLHPFSEYAAQDPAEVFMTGITQEGTAVGQHADKSGQVTQVCQGSDLLAHPVKMIVEPPGAAVLDIAWTDKGIFACY